MAIGKSVRRFEDGKLLRGLGRYLPDIRQPGQLEAAFVRSPYAHARIVRVDVSAALQHPGVVAVYTAADLEGGVSPLVTRMRMESYRETPVPALAGEKVLYVGQAVAVVVAENRYIAEDACELVQVEYDPLPAVTDADQAMRADTVLLHENLTENVLVRVADATPDFDAIAASAPHTLRRSYFTNRHLPAPMEGRGCLADYDRAQNYLTVWSSTQFPFVLRTAIAESLAFSEQQIRVIAPEVGGGFGLKISIFPEEMVIPFCARTLGRPVKWVEDRRENLLTGTHSREHKYHVEVGFDDDGRVIALRAQMIADVGAYSFYPYGAVIEPSMASVILPGPYKIRHYAYDACAVATNKAPMGPYRGVSRPAVVFVMERLMDEIAAHLGLEPAEVRRRNLVGPDEFPYTSCTGLTYESGSYIPALDRALAMLGPVERGAVTDRHRRGVGIATFIEQTALGAMAFVGRGMEYAPGYDSSEIRVEPTGAVTVRVGVSSQGQGHETVFAQVVADALGLPVEQVQVRASDTAFGPYGLGAFASRSAVIGGGACLAAAEKIKTQLRHLAAHLLEVSPEDVLFEPGALRVAGTNLSVGFQELSRIAHKQPYRLPPGMEPGLHAVSHYIPPPSTFSNGTHIAVVLIDTQTGMITLERYLVVEDCGRVINPMIVEGQLHGGVAQGIGGALYEHMIYDEHGQPLTGSFMDYLLPGSTEVPHMEVDHIETPSPYTLGGFKGMGEGGTIGAPAAIANAVADALRPGRSDVNTLPLTPAYVLSLVERAGAH